MVLLVLLVQYYHSSLRLYRHVSCSSYCKADSFQMEALSLAHSKFIKFKFDCKIFNVSKKLQVASQIDVPCAQKTIKIGGKLKVKVVNEKGVIWHRMQSDIQCGNSRGLYFSKWLGNWPASEASMISVLVIIVKCNHEKNYLWFNNELFMSQILLFSVLFIKRIWCRKVYFW